MDFIRNKATEPLILEVEEHTEEEWKILCKIFGLKEAERIVVKDYTLEAWGEENKTAKPIEIVDKGYKSCPYYAGLNCPDKSDVDFTKFVEEICNTKLTESQKVLIEHIYRRRK